MRQDDRDCGIVGGARWKQCPRNRDRAEAERDKGALGGEEARGDWGEREDEQHLEPAKPESAEPAEPKAAVPEAVSTPQYKRHSQAQTASRQETGQSQEFEIVAKKKKKKKNIQSEEGEPKLDPGLVFVGSGEKTQSPGVIVAESGGDPQPMPDEELTSSPEAVPPCPEEEGTSTELPQSDYETVILLKMSMVLFASVVRVRDGLPLSASTDYEQDRGVQESKKYLKTLSKKLSQLPDRCTLKTGQYNINFTSSFGMGYMMVCMESYPSVLAFSFLDELQREFIVLSDMKRISSAVRPYSFIDFDSFIQKTKQRYNSPRSLSTKINLADMQTEIKLRPTYQLSTSDLGTVNGFAHQSTSKYKGTGSAHRYHPCADSGGAKMNTRCPPKRVLSAARFFTLCRLIVQPPQSYSVGGQCSSGQLTGKPAGAWPDYRGHWCAVSRGHSGRPNPPSPQTTLCQLSAAPWELPSTVGCGIAWTRTRNVQAIERILHSSEGFYWMRHSGAPTIAVIRLHSLNLV
ncbi:UNVERIFIED_CONTAM: hypothetical protein FKN15_043167 [Acipenser sinensis]